jgi:hypothetical protein
MKHGMEAAYAMSHSIANFSWVLIGYIASVPAALH